jgi:hypothetical protein
VAGFENAICPLFPQNSGTHRRLSEFSKYLKEQSPGDGSKYALLTE